MSCLRLLSPELNQRPNDQECHKSYTYANADPILWVKQEQECNHPQTSDGYHRDIRESPYFEAGLYGIRFAQLQLGQANTAPDEQHDKARYSHQNTEQSVLSDISNHGAHNQNHGAQFEAVHWNSIR